MAKGRFEGSPADKREDRKGAKKMGVSMKAYERSATDKRKDKAGQKAMDAKKRKAKR
jgi:hypothetical protein